GGAAILCRETKTGANTVLRLDLSSGKTTTLWKGLAQFNPAGSGADHGAFIARYEDVNTPPNVYRFTSDLASKTQLSEIEPRLTGIHPGSIETFETTIPRLDGGGNSVASIVLLPPGAKKGDRLPTLFVVYPRANYMRSGLDYGGGDPGTMPAA